MKDYDLIIIGAGAAGLTAAIAFRRRCGGTALIVDANREPGAKILATGNGRCNLSNESAPGWEATRDFFGSLGVLLDTDEPSGRAYPQSRQAPAIRDALIMESKNLGCEFLLGTRVTSVVRVSEDDSFAIGTERGAYRAKQVVVATGGKACPRYGNMGDGYAFARSLGIEVTPIRPALVPFVYSDEARDELSALSGVRAKANVSLISYCNGGTNSDSEVTSETGAVGAGVDLEVRAETSGEDVKVIAEASGEVQFTDYGLSGICVFDLSRYYKTGGLRASVAAEEICGRSAVLIDLAPNHTEEEIAELISPRRAAGLSGIVHPKIADFILKKLKTEKPSVSKAANNSETPGLGITDTVDAAGTADTVDAADTAVIVAAVKKFRAPIKGTKGWKEAQITAGGVAMSEVDEKHFESKKAPGLYFAGEVLDYDGPSGGYNLDHAWSTGQKAGKAAGAYCASYLRG
jgi:predicted flavoprotein YhiN